MQVPLPVGAVLEDPHAGAVGAARGEVVAGDAGAVPPAGLDALGGIHQLGGLRQRAWRVEEPYRAVARDLGVGGVGGFDALGGQTPPGTLGTMVGGHAHAPDGVDAQPRHQALDGLPPGVGLGAAGVEEVELRRVQRCEVVAGQGHGLDRAGQRQPAHALARHQEPVAGVARRRAQRHIENGVGVVLVVQQDGDPARTGVARAQVALERAEQALQAEAEPLDAMDVAVETQAAPEAQRQAMRAPGIGHATGETIEQHRGLAAEAARHLVDRQRQQRTAATDAGGAQPVAGARRQRQRLHRHAVEPVAQRLPALQHAAVVETRRQRRAFEGWRDGQTAVQRLFGEPCARLRQQTVDAAEDAQAAPGLDPDRGAAGGLLRIRGQALDVHRRAQVVRHRGEILHGPDLGVGVGVDQAQLRARRHHRPGLDAREQGLARGHHPPAAAVTRGDRDAVGGCQRQRIERQPLRCQCQPEHRGLRRRAASACRRDRRGTCGR